jgi:hypothetical protein
MDARALNLVGVGCGSKRVILFLHNTIRNALPATKAPPVNTAAGGRKRMDLLLVTRAMDLFAATWLP